MYYRWSTLSQIFGMRWNFVKIYSVSTYFASLTIVQIEESLEQFYLHCLLPELADPRFGCRGNENTNIRNQDLKNAKRMQILGIENLNLKLRAPRGLPVREPHYIVEVSWSPGWPTKQKESEVKGFCKIGPHLLEVDMMSLCCRRRTWRAWRYDAQFASTRWACWTGWSSCWGTSWGGGGRGGGGGGGEGGRGRPWGRWSMRSAFVSRMKIMGTRYSKSMTTEGKKKDDKQVKK